MPRSQGAQGKDPCRVCSMPNMASSIPSSTYPTKMKRNTRIPAFMLATLFALSSSSSLLAFLMGLAVPLGQNFLYSPYVILLGL